MWRYYEAINFLLPNSSVPVSDNNVDQNYHDQGFCLKRCCLSQVSGIVITVIEVHHRYTIEPMKIIFLGVPTANHCNWTRKQMLYNTAVKKKVLLSIFLKVYSCLPTYKLLMRVFDPGLLTPFR